MADPVKKFSFGFTKTTKKPSFTSKPRNEAKAEKQLIDCLEGKLIKVKGDEKCVEEKPLIIPLQQSTRRVLVKSENGEVSRDQKSYFGENVVIKQEKLDAEELLQSSQPTDKPALPIKVEPSESVPSTLEEIAAREILQEAENLQKKDDYSNLTVSAAPESDELSAEPTAEDYKAIPVSAFGIAMLKGMGWQEEAGIGKKPQKVATVEATGPKRLSSAAEQKLRAAKMAPRSETMKEQEELKLTKGALVQILSGSSKGEYGEVEGFTDECDRVLVKLSIRGVTVSFSEAALQVVTKSEYSKNSRVLNSSKYEEVKNKVSQSLEEPSRQSSSKRLRRSSSEGERDKSHSPRRRRERSPDQRKRSPDRRKERSPRDRPSYSDKKYQHIQKKSPSSSPDRKRRKPEGKLSRKESPRRRSSSSPSSVRDSKKRNYEESSKRSRNDNEKSRHSREDTYLKRRSNSKSVSPQSSRKRVEKSREDSSPDSESQRKVKKSGKKKHKRKSSSDSGSSSTKRSSGHKKKKKSHKKKKSKRRESSSSPERRKK